MTLQHKLRIPRSRVPELDPSILRAGEDPVSVWGERDGEHEVLVAFEGLDAAAALGGVAGVPAARSDELPHLDCFVERTGDEVLAVRGEGHGVHGVLVAVWSLKTFDEITCSGIPNSNALVKGTGSDILGVG